LAVRLAITAGNIDDLPRRWRRARSQGIEPRPQIMTAGEANTQIVSPERAKALFEELARIDREEFGRVWDLPPSLTGRSCKRHLFAAHLTPCGTIFACVGVTIPLGNIRTEPLRKILDESEVLENIRDFHQKVKEPCRTCSQTTDCYGCRGSTYQLTGDYLAGDQLCWKAAGTQIPVLPITVNGLIPHGASMRMVDRLMQVGERDARLEFVVRKDSPFVDADGRLDETAYIETIAQSFAASHGFHMTPEELANQRGLLLGAKDLIVSGSAHAGDRLIVHLRKVARFGDFGVVEGSIFHDDGALVATGEIKIWRPTDDAVKALQT
jgi:radical SAM protein with 4Fe4S-binding SPASM domain